MNEDMIPKWQRELQSFLGIKSGIILEGNVYDEFPLFRFAGEDAIFNGTDNMDETIRSLIKQEQTEVVFFNPLNGFYCTEGNLESQRKTLMRLFNGYTTTEIEIDHGNTLCVMPGGKEKKKGNGAEGTAEIKRYIWISEIIRDVMLGKTEKYTDKENIVFVLNFASRLEACNLSESESNIMFLNLMVATTSVQAAKLPCNSIIFVVDKYNDIPAWVYLNNPNIRTISVCVPDRNTRRLYLENLRGELTPYQLLSQESYDPGRQFVAETEGLRLQELQQILYLACKKEIKPQDINLAFRLYRYGVLDNPWEKLENNILIDIEKKLTQRVKGQKEAIEKVKTVITRAVKGLSGLQHSGSSHKPKGIMFFAGPTGVGKTETAKALAEAIFGDENACIRFDMSEYRQEHSDQKLFGAPPGYVGYEGGGQLTNAVKNRPFSVILFDEIEKASPTIMDKFLQILEDGRMTDNQGNTVYFGETIIIFTSNIGLTKEETSSHNTLQSVLGSILGATPHRVPTITIEDPMVEDTPEFRSKVTAILTEGVKSYFNDNGRPELLNRLGEDNIIVFQFINKQNAEEICKYKLEEICRRIEEEKKINIDVMDIIDMLCEKAILERANGGRGVGNMLEREFLNPLANYICTLHEMPAALKCHAVGNCIEFEVISNDD